MEDIKFYEYTPFVENSEDFNNMQQDGLKDFANYYKDNGIIMNNDYFKTDNVDKSNEEINRLNLLKNSTNNYINKYIESIKTPAINYTVNNTFKQDLKNHTGTAAHIINFFVNKGLTREQAAGIAGNLMHESGFNTNALGDNQTSYGIAQWHKNRNVNLRNFASNNNLDYTQLNTQLEFLNHELNTSERRALEALKKTVTAEEATETFMNLFERPNKMYANLQKRIQYTKQFLL